MREPPAFLIFAAALFGSGAVYQQFYRPVEVGGIQLSGRTVEINIRVIQNQWKWEPEVIKVQPGDKARLKIYNEDDYDHGFAIDVFGVNRRLFPKSETLVEFTASMKGKFPFYCSVPCGEGHYDQIGHLIVIE